jgi:hypothetical protein
MTDMFPCFSLQLYSFLDFILNLKSKEEGMPLTLLQTFLSQLGLNQTPREFPKFLLLKAQEYYLSY